MSERVEFRPSTFRRLWQPPGRFVDRRSDRRVSFLELFFDLVFVVVISQLAHRLAEHPTWSGVGWFVFLFYAVWSAWINGTLYYDLHGTNDVSVRVFTFAQMLTVAVMAIYIGEVPGEGSPGFAIAYAVNTFILVVLWFRTGLHDPSHRPGSVPYSIGYLLAATLFAVSAGLDGPEQYWLWAGGLVLEAIGYLVGMRRWKPPATQRGEARITTTPSLIERLGLFVIIVLGEVIVGAVEGVAEIRPVEFDEVAIGMLGVLIAIGLWWTYFDLVSHRAPVSSMTQPWIYLHLPLVIAMAAGGAGVLNTVAHAARPLPDGVRWLLVGSLATAVLSVALVARTLETRREQPAFYRIAEIVLAASSLLCLGVGLTDWGAKATLTSLVALLLVPVVVGLVAWLRLAEHATVDVG